MHMPGVAACAAHAQDWAGPPAPDHQALRASQSAARQRSHGRHTQAPCSLPKPCSALWPAASERRSSQCAPLGLPQPLSMLQISAAPAWTGTPAASPGPAQPSSAPPVNTAPTTAPFSGFPQAFSTTPVVPSSDTQVVSSALPSPEAPCNVGMSQPHAACTHDQAEQVAPAQPEDLPELHTLNLELLKSQRKLEQV